MERGLCKGLLAGALMSAVGLMGQSASAASEPVGKVLSEKAGILYPAVIAHRGASYDAPESTAPAYLLARDLGADYLELDLQRTRDGVLIALHDDNLKRTTNVAQRFPDRADQPVSSFTWEELKSLDAGTWFNTAHPERARPSFAGQKILTLDEVIDIAEGGQNKPGLYIETKQPKLFPGIEKDLKEKLRARGWLGEPAAKTNDSQHVHVASMPGRVVLQTFEKSSMELLQQEMPQVPKVLLLWLGNGSIEPKSTVPFAESGEKDKAAYYAKQEIKSKAEYESWLDWAKAHGALGVGPSSALTHGGDQSYADLVKPWMNQMAHEKGLIVHPYTVDEAVDFKKISDAGVDGFFTNRTAELLKFYDRPAKDSIDAILKRHGY
ncbi:glycerophosphoryl diester phosphodiesterase [Pseudomonas asuensis]|uniref:Glycerophosphoryl diester phosphodiesterase n=1 Tax=Pseudomonas asuensis TaxID=1825787 RepID=A0ABQ2GFR4_9PSED|nr:glycerophosphodiester phosphodiesterase [Pseudomonas asuensis]GGL93591.1 glycerophosphoryl diester phosphodiesterase [Pseudomonas asuensis]